jgi:hypothetical protein
MLAAALVATWPFAARAQDPRMTAAHRAALDWLALIDKGDAATAWSAASALFRDAAERERWVRALEEERRLLGAFVSRTLAASQAYTEIPGLADKGEYAMLVYRTAFAARGNASERVTLVREPDGTWRVAGYVIA